MDSSSGFSSNSSGIDLIDQRKRKRMISNRESARRSRLRKQKQLDELMAQVARLRQENQQIMNGLNVTSQHCVNVEAENTILRTQADELSHRLQSLNEIVNGLNTEIGGGYTAYEMGEYCGFVNEPWNCFSQPIVTAAAAAAAEAGTGFYY